MTFYQKILVSISPFLCRFQWFRRLYGGEWKLWYVDVPVCGEVWFSEPFTCIKPWKPLPGESPLYPRPHTLCRCNAICTEKYPRKMPVTGYEIAILQLEKECDK